MQIIFHSENAHFSIKMEEDGSNKFVRFVYEIINVVLFIDNFLVNLWNCWSWISSLSGSMYVCMYNDMNVLYRDVVILKILVSSEVNWVLHFKWTQILLLWVFEAGPNSISN